MSENEEIFFPVDMYKKRFMILKEWRHKTPPEIAFNKINLLTRNEIVSLSRIKKWYNRFDERNFGLFEENSDFYVSSFQQSNEKHPNDSFVLLTDDDYFSWKMATNDGRFLIFPYYCYESKDPKKSSSITIYDLFKGTKRTNFVSFKTTYLDLVVFEGYFLAVEKSQDGGILQIHSFKINYDDLSIEELKTFDASYLKSFAPTQLNGQKFVIFNRYDAIIGQILENGSEIFFNGQVEYFDTTNMYGKRLWNNKLHGFGYDRNTRNILGTMTFLELDLETMEKNKMDAPLLLKDYPDLELHDFYPYPYCWTNDCLYAMFKMSNRCIRQHRLFVFDSTVLKWTDVGITATNSLNIFVDENHILTLSVGEGDEQSSAVYRIALRKPDTLMNLIKLFAVKESNLYGNDGYVKISRQL